MCAAGGWFVPLENSAQELQILDSSMHSCYSLTWMATLSPHLSACPSEGAEPPECSALVSYPWSQWDCSLAATQRPLIIALCFSPAACVSVNRHLREAAGCADFIVHAWCRPLSALYCLLQDVLPRSHHPALLANPVHCFLSCLWNNVRGDYPNLKHVKLSVFH